MSLLTLLIILMLIGLLQNVSKPLKVIKVERPLTCLQEVGDSVWSGSLDGFVRIYDKVVRNIISF